MPAVRRSSRLLHAVPVGVLALAAASSQASAQPSRPRSDAEACFESAERAQPLMRDRKLRGASRELAVCSRDVCPRAARTDCKAWLDEISRVEPTVVFRAREARAGGDVAVDDVKVSVDGEVVVASRIDETPVLLDAGAHAFRFEHGSFAAVEQRFELREGESRRLVDVVFRSGGDASGTPSVAPVPGPSAGSSTSTAPPSDTATGTGADHGPTSAPVPALAWGLLGGGVLALGVGITFEAVGLSARSTLANGCGVMRTCSQSAVDSAHNQVLAGDIGVGIGVALLAGAAYVYFTRGPASSAHDTSALRVGVSPLPGGLAAALEGSL
jgi:hypothetical protein